VPIEFNFLAAGKGDSILIFIDEKTLLIDGGDNFEIISLPMNKIKKSGRNIDLMILTHQDDDHIRGLLQMLRIKPYRSIVRNIWFNSFEYDNIFAFDSLVNTSTRKAIKFYEFVYKMKLENSDFKYESYISTKNNLPNTYLPHTKINVLSPTPEKLKVLEKKYLAEKEKVTLQKQTSKGSIKNAEVIEELYPKKINKDSSVTNGSSIAFILTYKNKYNFLLLGDAHIDVIVSSLINMRFSKKHKFKFDFVKLSHHGSIKNINQDFLNIIETKIFVILTNGAQHNHPDPETLSFIILNPERNLTDKITFIFNYKSVMQKFIKLPAFNKYNMSKYNFSFEHVGNNNFIFG